jgi:uncharacterized protein (UPF0261 family)
MYSIGIIGTYDTKAGEMLYVADRVKASGHHPLLIDAGAFTKPGVPVEYPNTVVASRAAGRLDRL